MFNSKIFVKCGVIMSDVYEEKIVELFGALIALGRAAEGNKNRPTLNTDNALLNGLYLAIPGTGLGSNQWNETIQRLRQEKIKLVPRCSTCEKECGRNDEFSLYELVEFKPDITTIKEALLMEILTLEPWLRGKRNSDLSCKALNALYDSLYWLGKDCSYVETLKVLQQLNEIKQQFLTKYICENQKE